MEQGDIIEVVLHGMSHDGRAVGRLDSGITVFVQGGLIGQTVEAEVVSVKKRMIEAIFSDLIKKSPFEVEPYCEHALECGGCPWMPLSYDKQLEEKTALVRNALVRIGHFKEFEDEWDYKLLPILSPMDLMHYHEETREKVLTGYRNKMEFAFGVETLNPLFARASVTTRVGLKKRASHDIIDVTSCKLQKPISMGILEAVQAYCKHKEFAFLRYLVIRTPSTGRVTVELITWPLAQSKSHAEIESNCVLDLAKTVLAITGVDGFLHSVRADKADVAYGERIMREWGETELTENIKLNVFEKPRSFALGNKAFFQVNTAMTELLYSVIYAFASHVLREKNNKIWDIYCGVGSIALSLSSLAVSNKANVPAIGTLNKKVLDKVCDMKDDKKKQDKNPYPFLFGIENVSSAIALAKRNAGSCEFAVFETAQSKYLGQYFKKYGAPDLIVLDPPRAGLDDKTAEALLKNVVPYCILVSCNPTTLARDLEILSDKYKICAVQPVDLFPHTSHVETVVLLSQK